MFVARGRSASGSPKAGGPVELSDQLMVVFVEHLSDLRRHLRSIQKIREAEPRDGP
jgi:hypothetical protein